MKLPEASLLRLDGGMRLVHIHHRSSRVGIFGISVRAGSADESEREHGLAHLVEHTIFKGTASRSSWDIINCMERTGGELNAFTTKEETTVYSLFPSSDVATAISLISDLAINSRFPAEELQKEREVVLDEIYSYRDTPSEAIFDDFEEQVFAGTPLAHNILGSPADVRRLKSADCLSFLRRHYTRKNIVAFYSGPDKAEKIAPLVSKAFEPMEGRFLTSPSEQNVALNPSRKTTIIKGLHQAHAICGIEAASLYSPDRYADDLFANIIGGPGMNSLLNVELRERRGLVYTVEAGVTHFSSSGLLSVYYGCDAGDSTECADIITGTMRGVADMSESKLKKLLAGAKRQYLGQSAIASENRENRVFAAARSVLFTDSIPPYGTLRQAIAAISPEQIRLRAEALASTPYALVFSPK